jgi:hypothetical protein
MKVKMKRSVGAFANSDGALVNPGAGEEVDVTSAQGKALVEADAAEEVKARESRKAQTGPEETR